MEIKLLSGTMHSIVDVSNNGDNLEVVFNAENITAEEAEAAFQGKENLKRLEVYGETGVLTSTLLDYTVLSEVKLKSGEVIVVLMKETDDMQQRITDAHATATEALAETEEVKAENEQIIANMDYLAMEMGLEV